MPKQPKEGTCHICLKHGKLTKEHVPPRRAFNRENVRAQTLSTIISRGTGIPLGSVVPFRGGMGAWTLCEECNRRTGARYGRAFAAWASQASVFAEKCEQVDGQEKPLLLPFHIEPLAVLKQIATMALAVAQPNRVDALAPLRHFVQVPYEQLATHEISFRVYLNPKRAGWKLPQARIGMTGAISNIEERTSTYTIAEIALPPLGYWVAWNSSRHRHLRAFEKLADITHFGRFQYRDKTRVYLPMPVRLPCGPIMFREQYTAEQLIANCGGR